MISLENRWALVTGSSRGIGQQIACGLAAMKCNVIVHGRMESHLTKTLKMLEKYGVKTHAVCGELSAIDGVNSIIDGVRSGPGSVDILYNNAAIQNKWKPIWEITRDEWLETFQINFFSVIILCNTFAIEMKKRGFGRIINLTSGIKDVPQLSPYSVSKASIDKYSQDLAFELNNTNVLINFLDPGWLRTDLGGPDGMFNVDTVIPGALVPALLEDYGPTGRLFSAQDFKYLK